MAAAKADIHRYIANLESGQPIPSAEFFGGGKVGAQKRDIIQKIMGFVLTKKQLREGAYDWAGIAWDCQPVFQIQ
jgi:hypothetical protein